MPVRFTTNNVIRSWAVLEGTCLNISKFSSCKVVLQTEEEEKVKNADFDMVGLVAARKHQDKFTSLVDIMRAGSQVPFVFICHYSFPSQKRFSTCMLHVPSIMGAKSHLNCTVAPILLIPAAMFQQLQWVSPGDEGQV